MNIARATERHVESAPFGVWGLPALKRLPALSLVLVFFAVLAGAAEVPSEKNILVLYSFSDRGLFESFDDLKTSLRSRVSTPLNFHVEYLEVQRFEDPAYEKSLSETLRIACRREKFDLVIVAAYPALAFVLRHRHEMFPGVPIIFNYVYRARLREWTRPPGVAGVTVTIDVGGTLDLALRLHPGTENVAVVTGTSEFERFWLGITRAEMQRYEGRVKLIEVVGDSTEQITDRVSRLPQHTVLLFETIPMYSSQPVRGIYDSIAASGQHLPTYCVWWNYCVGHGAIAGSFPDYGEQREHTTELAARILSGENPDNIPVEHDSGARVYADWRELRRWNIPESAMPPGSRILYRQPTAWELYEKYIVAGIVLVLVQAVLIAGLVWERARKRRAETVLRESEKRFRVMADSTPSLVWMCDKNGEVTYLNERRVTFTGRDPDAGFGDVWTAYIHPDDRKNVMDANARALERREAFTKEYRLLRRDGVYRWMFDVASPRVNGDKAFAGFIGSAIDITDQKLAQEALESVSGRLIEAQEKERTRIARELHDDICQRLVLLSMELEQANQSSIGSGAATKEPLMDIRQHCADIAGDVQALSHQLHSSKLDSLGIVAALRSFCREFAQKHGVIVEFTDENVPSPLHKDVSLCLFRVAQEALRNAAKHSGESRFAVDLRGTPKGISLEVQDAGVGFDVEGAKRNPGLGLVSMQERVHLVHGAFTIESRPGQGTRVVALVPVVADNGAPSMTLETSEASSLAEAE